MFNKAILIGKLCKEINVRYTSTWTLAALLKLVVNSEKDETLFIDVIVFGKQAEICKQRLHKGDYVLVEGRLRKKKWDWGKGEIEIVADKLKPMNSLQPNKQF